MRCMKILLWITIEMSASKDTKATTKCKYGNTAVRSPIAKDLWNDQFLPLVFSFQYSLTLISTFD